MFRSILLAAALTPLLLAHSAVYDVAFAGNSPLKGRGFLTFQLDPLGNGNAYINQGTNHASLKGSCPGGPTLFAAAPEPGQASRSDVTIGCSLSGTLDANGQLMTMNVTVLTFS